MRIIYAHGLDSTANSVKGQLLERYCLNNHPDISVIRPDLNLAPQSVAEKLTSLAIHPEPTLLMGSSLGGYFASLVSNATGCPLLLLNPSTQPHLSLQRFLIGKPSDGAKDDIIYQTSGGWNMTRADLNWFSEHILTEIISPKRVLAVIKAGDELLNPAIAIQFYQSQGAEVIVQSGGDHRMSDFEAQLPVLMSYIDKLMANL